MLTDVCVNVLGTPMTYIDVFSAIAALFIFLFVLYIAKRDNAKKKNK